MLAKNWSNLWGPKIRRNIRHLAFFLAEPGLVERENEDLCRPIEKWRRELSWTYWQGTVDNVLMLILTVVKFIFQGREIGRISRKLYFKHICRNIGTGRRNNKESFWTFFLDIFREFIFYNFFQLPKRVLFSGFLSILERMISRQPITGKCNFNLCTINFVHIFILLDEEPVRIFVLNFQGEQWARWNSVFRRSSATAENGDRAEVGIGWMEHKRKRRHENCVACRRYSPTWPTMAGDRVESRTATTSCFLVRRETQTGRSTAPNPCF